MKYSEQLFKLPVIMYDGMELHKALEKEKDYGAKIDVPFAIGELKMPIDEYKGCFDSWTRDKTIEEVSEEGKKGFNACIVMTRTLGDFLCAWRKERFEEEYDKHLEKLDEYYKQIEEDVLIKSLGITPKED